MGYLEIDYNKVAQRVFEKNGKTYTGSYLRGVANGTYQSDGLKIIVGKCKGAAFKSINYKMLSFDISEELGAPYTAAYVKRVIDGVYSSSAVKKIAERLMKENK